MPSPPCRRLCRFLCQIPHAESPVPLARLCQPSPASTSPCRLHVPLHRRGLDSSPSWEDFPVVERPAFYLEQSVPRESHPQKSRWWLSPLRQGETILIVPLKAPVTKMGWREPLAASATTNEAAVKTCIEMRPLMRWGRSDNNSPTGAPRNLPLLVTFSPYLCPYLSILARPLCPCKDVQVARGLKQGLHQPTAYHKEFATKAHRCIPYYQ